MDGRYKRPENYEGKAQLRFYPELSLEEQNEWMDEEAEELWEGGGRFDAVQRIITVAIQGRESAEKRILRRYREYKPYLEDRKKIMVNQMGMMNGKGEYYKQPSEHDMNMYNKLKEIIEKGESQVSKTANTRRSNDTMEQKQAWQKYAGGLDNLFSKLNLSSGAKQNIGQELLGGIGEQSGYNIANEIGKGITKLNPFRKKKKEQTPPYMPYGFGGGQPQQGGYNPYGFDPYAQYQQPNQQAFQQQQAAAIQQAVVAFAGSVKALKQAGITNEQIKSMVDMVQ